MIRLSIFLAFRNLRKSLLYSLTNILGLAIGIFSFLAICMYNFHELSFDNFHSNNAHIYRLWDTFNSSERQSAMMPFKWTQYLADEFPEIEHATSIQLTNMVVKDGHQVINERRVAVVDTGFTKLFDFPVISGDQSRFFRNPGGVVLEKETAIKYFGSVESALGKTMEIGITGNFSSFIVEGIVQCPSNSHLQFDLLVPFERVIQNSYNPPAFESFSTHFVYSYVLIPNGFNHDQLQSQFKQFLIRNGNERLSEKYTTSFQPLNEVYLDSFQEFDFGPRGSRKNVNILWSVAFLVMLIAIVNFINLSTAKSLKRVKEVSIRKIFGSNRQKLILQFIIESLLISFLAGIIAVLLLIANLEIINDISGVDFELWDVMSLEIFLLISAISILIGIVAGLYPAFLISSFGSLQILKSNVTPKGAGAITRKVLISFQFGIAILLIVGNLVVRKQLQFMSGKELGIETEQVLLIDDGSAVSDKKDKILLLRNQLSFPEVVSVTATSTHPGVPTWSVGFTPEGYSDRVSYPCVFTDHDFVKTYDIQVVNGRDFDIGFTSDSSAFLINETARDLFAVTDSTWKINPLGKKIKSGYLKMDGPVIGVLKDFHFESVHSEIKPLIVMVYPRFKSSLQIRLKTQNMQATLDRIEQVWSTINPDIPFEYEFIDAVFDKSFKADKQLSSLFNVFSIISMVLAMVGLFALTSFMTKQQLKASSIRKVLGANIFQITSNLLRQISLLLLIAIVVASPLSYLLMDQWLNDFPYRINISLWILALAALIIVIVSAVTICYHTLQLVNTNPIKTLRDE